MQSISFGGYCQSDAISSTGVNDSLTISIDVVKEINKRLIDLQYSKEEIKLYKEIIENNEYIINDLEIKVSDLENINSALDKQYTKEKNKKHFWFGGCCVSSVIAVLLIIL